MSYLKPQNPIKLNNDYIYPLTTADQVITGSGERLNSLFKKTIKETATLQIANWSETKPYTQTITLTESTDDYNVDANVAYGDGDNAALHAAAGCISYIKKNHKEITFYCLKNKPEVDIPIEITGTCRNTIATIEEGIKLNFDIVAYTTEEDLLADTPAENTIGVITNVPITGYRFSATEPEDMIEGEVWIKTGDDSSVAFDIVEGAKIYPLSAKQYVNDAWVDVTAMSYQNGEWVDWVIWLYNNGDEYTDITGGWVASKTALFSNITATTPSFTKDNDSMIISLTGPSSGGRGGSIRTENKIKLDAFEKISVYFNVNSNKNGRVGLAVASTVPSVLEGNAAAQMNDKTDSPTLIELDVSTLSGEFYIFVSVTAYSGATTRMDITDIICT